MILYLFVQYSSESMLVIILLRCSQNVISDDIYDVKIDFHVNKFLIIIYISLYKNLKSNVWNARFQRENILFRKVL